MFFSADVGLYSKSDRKENKEKMISNNSAKCLKNYHIFITFMNCLPSSSKIVNLQPFKLIILEELTFATRLRAILYQKYILLIKLL